MLLEAACLEESKIQAVSSFPVPETKKQVRTFLGLTGYYRRFIPSYATIAAPLTDLTRKYFPNRVKWTPGCSAAFSKLKKSCVLHRFSGAQTLTKHSFSRLMPAGTDERRRREGACNYRIHASAIQIQIISESTSKYGNQLFNQAS